MAAREGAEADALHAPAHGGDEAADGVGRGGCKVGRFHRTGSAIRVGCGCGPSPAEAVDEALERLEHEQRLLEMPHVVVLPDDARRVEGVPGDVVGERVEDLFFGRHDASAEDAELARLLDQPKLGREPVEALQAHAVLAGGV